MKNIKRQLEMIPRCLPDSPFRETVIKVTSAAVAEMKRLTEENEVLRSKPSGVELATLLVNNHVVDFAAVDDPDDYDGGKTVNAIFRVAEAVRG